MICVSPRVYKAEIRWRSRKEGRFSEHAVSVIRQWLTHLKEKKIDVVGLFQRKKLLLVLLFLSCVFKSFFGIDILPLFNFIAEKLKVFENDEALQFVQLLFFPCLSWIYSLQAVCIQQYLVSRRMV